MKWKYLLLLAFLGILCMQPCSCQTFPTRTISPLLKPGVWFHYHVHVAMFGQERDMYANLTITSVQGQKIYLSSSASDADLRLPTSVDVGNLIAAPQSSEVFFVGEKLNVGDPVMMGAGETYSEIYSVQTLSQEQVLGSLQTVLSVLAERSGVQTVVKWHRQGGFLTFMGQTKATGGVTEGVTITLISSNVDLTGEQEQNWLIQFLVQVGNWVNSALKLNMNPQLVGFITLLGVAVVLLLIIKFISSLSAN